MIPPLTAAGIDLPALVADFRRVALLAGVPITPAGIEIQILQAPHQSPSNLPAGKSAVYVFFLGDRCLKVGKAGPRSHARYASQHYNFASSKSNLSRSLMAARGSFGLDAVPDADVGEWIKSNTARVNLLLDASLGIFALTLLESFVQCRLKPLFEGFKSRM
jgi:hypothetical protein